MKKIKTKKDRTSGITSGECSSQLLLSRHVHAVKRFCSESFDVRRDQERIEKRKPAVEIRI